MVASPNPQLGKSGSMKTAFVDTQVGNQDFNLLITTDRMKMRWIMVHWILIDFNRIV